MHIDQLKSFLEQTANPEFSADWDHSGIQVPGLKKTIEKLAVTLDPTPTALQKAIEQNVDFVLTHHPLSLNPRFPDQNDDYTTMLRQVLSNDIWLYAAHTSLDTQTYGPVSWLAQVFDLNNIHPVDPVFQQQPGTISPKENHPQPGRCGYGVIGDLNLPMPWSQFQNKLHSILNKQYVLSTGQPPEKISRMAYCPGSGMALSPKAFALGADIFLSGDLKFHQAQEIEHLGLTLDVGHFILEERMMAFWAKELQSSLAGEIQVLFIPGKDPFQIKDMTNPES